MTFSLNEVEVLAKRAARGAGYPWGLTEEAGKATRWLCSFGLDGCGALASLLRQVDAGKVSDQFTVLEGTTLKGNKERLCPLVVGAALSDRALATDNGALSLGTVSLPILLMPFVAALATQIKAPVTLRAATGLAVTDGQRVSLEGVMDDPSGRVTVEVDGALTTERALQQRADPAQMVWVELSQFAQRTYAPSTELSRRLGAGGGEAGND